MFFDVFLYFDQWPYRKTKQNQKQEKVCRSNWKISINRGILKHIWRKVIREKLIFRVLWNTLKDGLCCLRNESVSIHSFSSEHARGYGYYLIWASYTSLIITHINFFLRKLLASLNKRSKCWGSVSHGYIKFWFSGNANTGRHCLLLHFHLSC